MKKLTLPILAFSFSLFTLKAQTGYINTIAGNGIAGYNGDNLPATDAKLDTIQFVAVDDSQNVYIADAQNNRIRKVYNSTGMIATIAGTGNIGYTGDFGPATSADIRYPVAIVLDAAGNVYFTDNGNGVVRKITKTTGTINTVAGNGNTGNLGDDSLAVNCSFDDPTGLAIDNSGNLYISDPVASNVRIVRSSDNNIYEYAGTVGIKGYSGDGGPAIGAEFNELLGIAVDNSGNLYIADWMNNVVRKIDGSGNISTFAGIRGNATITNAGGNATTVPISSPTDVSCDRFGNVFVTDVNSEVIRMINVSTNISTVVAGNTNQGESGDGGPALAAEFNYPFGVCVDTASNIYISDLGNFKVRKVNSYVTAIPQITDKNGFSIYPNPATNVLNIQFAGTNSGKRTIEIMDITGQTINSFEKTINSNSLLPVDVSNLSTGLYFVKITDNTSGEVFKFIKE